MELRRYASLVLKWLWLLVLGTVLAGGIAYEVSRSQAPVYQASLKLLVNLSQGSSAGLDYSSLLASGLLTRTYAELLTGEDVVGAAIEKLGLSATGGGAAGADPTLADSIRKSGLALTADQIAPSVSAVVIRDTQLIELSVESENPRLAQNLANAIAEVFIQQRVSEQLGQGQASRDILRQQILDLEREMKAISTQIDQARLAGAAQADEVTRLQGQLSQNQVTYAQLVRSENDIELASVRSNNSLKIVEAAKLPAIPIRPRVFQTTLLAAIVGLLLALGVAFVAEYLDDTVKSEEDVTQATQLPTLAVIARARNAKGDRPLLSNGDDTHQLAEALRVLRVNIDFAWAGKPGKVIMVTSANPLEGKTTTTANLAMILARDSRRVIVVDGDLRRSSMHNAFDLDSKSGLSNLLADPTMAAASRLKVTSTPNLWLLAAGPTPPNPAELLGSERFADVVAELRREADVVLIDTPPLLGAVDPAVVARVVDGVILVTAAGETRVGALAKAVEILGRSTERILGVVLNKTTKGQSGYYYHYYHYRSRDDSGDSSASGGSPNGKTKQAEPVDLQP